MEYWSITAQLEGDDPPAFFAKLTKKNNKKITIPNEKAATAILKDLESAAFTIEKVQNNAEDPWRLLPPASFSRKRFESSVFRPEKR